MTDINIVVLVCVTSVLAAVAIYVLYAIVMFQGNKGNGNADLQLSTKNILDQVEVLFEKGEFALVQLLATKYLDRVPNHKEVRVYLAKAYFKDKKYNNSIKQCLEILKKTPNNLETRQLLGDCYIRKQYLGKAIKEYETVYETKNTDITVVRTLAQLYRDTEQLFSSIAAYNVLVELLDQNEEIAEVQLILAELNEEARDYPAAFNAYKSRLSIYPTDIHTNQKLVELYLKLNNQAKAIETLLFMLSFVKEPKILIWSYEQLIDVYAQMEEYEKAIEYSNKLLETQGADTFKVRRNIASFNLKLNNYANGITILEDLVIMSQYGYEVTLQLAESYIEQKEYEKALEKYIALLDKSTQKESKEVRNLISNLYIDWGMYNANNKNYEEGYRLLVKASEYNPTNSEIYYYKACIYIERKLYHESIELIHKAIEYDKQKTYYTKYLLKLSEAHHYLDNFFEEKKALSDLLKADNRNPMGLYRSGLMYIAQHDTKNAEESFKAALQYNPELLPAKYNLALLYESSNRDRAKELYIDILEHDPDFLEAKNALSDLLSSEHY